jgi:cell division protein YceG involved in septum cleavage
MKKSFLTALFVMALLAVNTNAQFDPNVFYNLSPQYQPTKSLDVVNDGKNFNKVWLDKTQNVSGQAWKITPVAGQPGFYRLSPLYQPTKSLDVVNDGKNFNQVWLEKTGNWTGQFWKITPVDGQPGFYRLSPQFQPTKSLDVVNDGKNFNQVWLEKTGSWTGQFWKITSLAPTPVRFKNRYTANQWINIEKGAATADAVQPAFLSAQWNMIPVAGTKFVRLESAWKLGTFLNVEKGIVEATAIPESAWSGHWELEEVKETRAAGAPIYYRLKNRWKMDLGKPAEYLNTEKGKLECTAVSLSFQSANWLIEKNW